LSTSPQTPCPLCNGNDYRFVTRTPDCEVYVCLVCGLSRTQPHHTAVATKVYTADYHRKHSYLASSLNEQVARMRLAMLRRLKPAARTFLDVGCATGYAMQLAQSRGWQVYGTDISGFATEYACGKRGLRNVHTGTLISAQLPEAYFDVIYCSHVLEHLSDPLDNLCEMHRLLRPDGVLFISVPNIRSVRHWLKGDAWYSPYHLYDYDVDTLRQMLKRVDFRVVRLWTDSPGFVPLRPRKRSSTSVPTDSNADAGGRELEAGLRIKRRLIRAYAAVVNFVADRVGWGVNLNALVAQTDG
jgi:SAM-dependent methyltransferase